MNILLTNAMLYAEIAEHMRMQSTIYDAVARNDGIWTEDHIAEFRYIERRIRALKVLSN